MTADSNTPFLAVLGPTGSGKSDLAMALAKAVGGEIVGCDSVQLYRRFDIGSAKPSTSDLQEIPHHLFDVLDPHQEYDAAQYAADARSIISTLADKGKPAVVVGGTGLYFRALTGLSFDYDLPKDDDLRQQLEAKSTDELVATLKELDPERMRQLHPNDRYRVVRALEINILTGQPVPTPTGSETKWGKSFTIVLDPDRASLHRRIEARTRKMLDLGLEEEVRTLLAGGVQSGCKPMQSIGYYQVAQMLAGELVENDLVDKIVAATRQYAKRQCTWFRKVERQLTLTQNDIAGCEGLLNEFNQAFVDYKSGKSLL